MVTTALETLITRWKADPGGTYRSWFLWEERIKNFRSIRRGIQEVVDEIDQGSFGVAYKGSSLETVVRQPGGLVEEQRSAQSRARCRRTRKGVAQRVREVA